MLKNTFHHLPGIGSGTERRIWAARIFDWGDFKEPYPLKWSPGRAAALRKCLEISQRHLSAGEPAYFTQRLPSHLHWRIFPEFRHMAVYMDIETSGLDRNAGIITTIALYDGRHVSYYINGRNLGDFEQDIQKFKLIVTFNGKNFDIPFIEKFFGIRLNQAHIDLRYVLASLGYKGGLKKCEARLGLERGELAGVDGFFAVLLWDEYQQNQNPKALDTLLSYNIQDTVTLETLMITAYNLKIIETPFSSSHRIDLPVVPPNPFLPDNETIERLRRRHAYLF